MRKTPQQQRSREMVDRIIDAGRRTLVAYGYEGSSTVRIARAAGISPGSLYQYFPDKDAIIGAIVDRFNEEVSARVLAHVTQVLTQLPEVGVRSSIAVLLDALSENSEVLRAIVDQPRFDMHGAIAGFERQIGELGKAAMVLRSDALPANFDPDATSWLLVRTVENLTIRYVLDQPAIEREVFLDHLTRLVLNFFR